MNEKDFKCRIMPLHKGLFAFALSILGDGDDAADCVQEAFSNLWHNRHKLDALQNIDAYATSTVKNIAINMAKQKLRTESSSPSLSLFTPDPGPSPHQSAEARDNLAKVAQILKALPENQRRVVVMSAVTGLSNTEIKEATGFSDDNVRKLLSRGRSTLKKLFFSTN